VLVTLDRAAAAGTFAKAAGLRVNGPVLPQIGLVTVAVPPDVSPAALAGVLRETRGVRYAAPEHRLSWRALPDDPALTAGQSGLAQEWWLAREGFSSAFAYTHGSGALVGIIDSGIDASHPEFVGKIAAAVPQGGVGDPRTDQNGHGTHVSGIACAGTNNHFGVAGAGYNCRILLEKTDLSDGSVAAAIIDATDAGALAINMSFGDDEGRPSVPAIDDALRYAYRHDVVLVAAAADTPVQDQGQPASTLQPAGTGADLSEGIGLTVTAATSSNERADFAGFGSEISLAAYGGGPGIVSTFPAGAVELERGSLIPPMAPCGCRTSVAGDQRFARLEGTSMAAPQVAAAAALIRRLNPRLHAADVIRILKQTARRSGSWSAQLGWGILDAGAAVRTARRIDRLAPYSRARAPRTSRSRRIVVEWTGRDPEPQGLVASGLRRYDVYVSRNGGRPTRIARTARRRLTFTGRAGSRYAFYTVATDRAGNREAAPRRADAVTRFLR
jgi:subtilisin family serine protease